MLAMVSSPLVLSQFVLLDNLALTELQSLAYLIF